MTINEALSEAIEKHKAGKLQEAEGLYRAILSVNENHPDANHNLGVLALSVGAVEASIPFFQKATLINPNVEQYHKSLQEAKERLKDVQIEPTMQEMQTLAELFGKGSHKEALPLAMKMTNDFPKSGFGWKVLGALLEEFGDAQDALDAKQKAVELSPMDAETHNNLGFALHRQERFVEAEDSYLKAISLKPDFAEAYANLGAMQKALDRFDEAKESYLKAVSLKPNYAKAYYNLAAMLKERGEPDEAERFYLKAIEFKPDYFEAYNDLGVALKEQCRFVDAEKSFKKAVSIKPDFAEAHSNLGAALNDQGRSAEALDSYRQAIIVKPDFVDAYNNLLIGSNYSNAFSVANYLEWANKFGALVTSNAKQKFTDHKLNNKKLRVGFVSGDLRAHPVGYFLENMLRYIKNIELLAYPTLQKEDSLTQRVKPCFVSWTPIHGISDEEAAKIIYNDKINILIDLSGHTAHNRLGVFGYKPAPIAVSWLGYFASTGVAEIDYFLGDRYAAPKEEESAFTEKIYRMPNSFLCFTPPSEAPDVSRLPALKNGFITFGCFNNLRKLNDDVISLWSGILRAMPTSKLFLKTKQLDDKHIADALYKKFQDCGVVADRLIFEGASSREEYLASYGRVDISLDPFPFPGGTTSVEGIWMGVPVLTLKGDRFIARQGESIAHNVGMPLWIASDKDEYVRKAIEFSADLEALAAIRANLRDKALSSPLFDGEGFARDFEGVMEAINASV